jgi:uncharacterized membrane protein YphA (DoxX/SURF4 family)
MSWLKHPVVTWIASIALGGIFIYSSWHKIADPPDFAKVILNYKLVPAGLINTVAILMPWFELLAGLALVTGVLRRGAALGIALLCVLFIAALSYNLAIGHPTICGCFSTYEAGKTLTAEQKFFKMKTEIALDVGFLLLALQVMYGSAARQRAVAADEVASGAAMPAAARGV